MKPQAVEGTTLHWLDGTPQSLPTGTSFGLPWAQGEIDRTTALTAGDQVPLQTWPLAYWPDGSLKWTGHALSSGTSPQSIEVVPGTPREPAAPVVVTESSSSIMVTTGTFSARFNKSGNLLINSLTLSGRGKVSDGKLIMHVQDSPDSDVAGGRPNVVSYDGVAEAVQVEQRGPVRAVIKVTGKYRNSTRALFPFSVRFYVAAGSSAIRAVHFFTYDGDQKKDFIKGIGFQFKTPMSDFLHDRHVRFTSGTGGVWGEPVRGISGLRREATAAMLSAQFEGRAAPAVSTWPATISAGLDDLPVWSDFTLDQLTPNQFTISKRTTAGEAGRWLNATGSLGQRASGCGYVGGGANGGVLFGLKDFWQAAPKGLDVRGAGTDSAVVTLWAYSPRAPAMDMRHYDVEAHGLDLTYEDVGNPDPDPTGVGRSYEVTIQVVPSTPARGDLVKWAASISVPPQLVATPQFYASHQLFGGRWNVPESSTPTAVAIERQRSALLDFYVAEVEQRQWYGFWDHGDFMHTYDITRHAWRYDVGGYAWDNGELGTDLWLWMSFLRTGRPDVFRLAYAMSRHLSEVDTHHSGPYAGLGSRHNVSHWGDGAKEARVAGSWLRRPFYYLTGDELMGDLMETYLQADQTLLTWEPLRKVLGPVDTSIAPGRVRIGPDWVALAGNWFAQWERTNDTQWRNRITTGMTDIGNFRTGLFTGVGSAVGWNPASARLFELPGFGTSSYHLTMVFGGAQFLMEAMDVITDQPKFDAAWLDFCTLYNGTNAEKQAKYGTAFNSGGFGNWYAGLQAYAGARRNDRALKERAWTSLNPAGGTLGPVVKVGGTDVITPINEIRDASDTNGTAQSSINQYLVLGIAPELAVSILPLVPVGKSSMDTLIEDEKKNDKMETHDAVPSTSKPEKRWNLKKLLCIR